MSLTTFWFVTIAVLWTGFLLLEGFDFGVGMLHGVLGRDEAGRKDAIGAIGPVWDGNEVWLIVAVAAMFAAFPSWYATMFSGFYLLMLVTLVGLILRGVSFEFRSHAAGPRGRRIWSATLVVGSAVVPFVLGTALGNLLHGVPIDAAGEFTGTLGSLLQPLRPVRRPHRGGAVPAARHAVPRAPRPRSGARARRAGRPVAGARTRVRGAVRARGPRRPPRRSSRHCSAS